MKTLYGEITEEQMAAQKRSLHSAIHWLLIYKEEDYPQLNTYFTALLYRINGLNKLLREPPEIVELLSVLQSARDELDKQDFNFHWYRKCVLDAHSLVDKIKEV